MAIAFCCLIAFLDGADTQALAIAAPGIAHQFAIGPGALGLIFSANLLGATIGATTCGALADRIGARRMLVACTIAFGVFQFFTSMAHDYTSLMLMRFAAGLGLGGAAPCFLALAAANTEPERRTARIGLIWACFPLGGFVGGFINGWLIQNLGWPTMFMVGGIAPVMVGLLLALLVADPPREDEKASTPRSAGILRTLAGDAALRYRAVLLASIYFAAFGTLAAVTVWVPSMMVARGFSMMSGGQILSWHALGALVSMAFAGVLVQRFGPRILFGGLLLSAAALAILGMSIGSFAAAALMMVVLGILLGLVASGGIALAQQIFPANVRVGGFGLTMASGRAGQMVLPAVVGWLLSLRMTADIVLGLVAITPLLGSLATAALGRTLRAEQRRD